MPEESPSTKIETSRPVALRTDAELFESRLTEIERLVESLSPGIAPDESTARQLQRRLEAINCLRFLAWSTAHTPDELAKELTEVDVAAKSIERIRDFADKYRWLEDFFGRLYRTEQGYKNEFTHVGIRPTLFLISRSLAVDVELYSHDKLLLSSRQSLRGLLFFVESLVDTISDVVEQANRTDRKLALRAIEPERVSRFLKVVERFKNLLTASPPTESNP